MTDHSLHVERIVDTRGFAALRESWAMLLEHIPDHRLFHTWEWLSTWYQHHRDAGDLWLLAARAPAGELYGVLPLRRVVKRVGPLRTRVLLPLFFRPPIHHAIIAPRGARVAVAEALTRYLDAHAAEWDVIDLDGFDADDAVVARLADGPGRLYERDPIDVPLIALPADWQTYEMKKISSRRRREIRRRERRLAKDHQDNYRYETLTDPDSVLAAFDQLAEFSRRRWHAQGVSSSFDDPRFVAFNHDILYTALERGWLRFYRLVIDGEVAALRYSYGYNNRFYAYQTVYNPRWASYSPGTLIFAHFIRQGMREGVACVDMLGRGDQNWKADWQTDTAHERSLMIGGGLRGYVWLLAARLGNAIQRAVRALLPEPALDRLRALQRRVTRL